MPDHPGIKHRELRHSDDMELIEITSPADFATTNVKNPDMAFVQNRQNPGGRWYKTNTFALMLWFGAGLALIGETARAERLIAVPSGQPLTLGEVLIDDSQGEEWVRFRFVAPEIGRDGVSYDQAAPDMDYLCQNLALPYLAEYALKPARIVISLSDRMVEFGKANSQVTQYFEAYRPHNDACIWENF